MANDPNPNNNAAPAVDTDKVPGNRILDTLNLELQRHHDLATGSMNNPPAYVGRILGGVTVISGILALTVVGSVVVIVLIDAFHRSSGLKVPEVLTNWGGIILGFYFGQFVPLIKDYLGK